MTHPKKEELVELIYGDIADARRSELESHLQACPECRSLAKGWRAAAGEMNGWKLPAASKRRSRFRLAPLAIAAAAVGLAVVTASAILSLRQEVRDLRTQLASRPGVTRAELTEVMSAVEARHQEQRTADQRTYLAALQQVQARYAETYAGLRKELETVAVLTEAGLEQARNQIASFTDSSRPIENSQQP